MTKQDQIDAFIEQAKARLDEMGAAAKEFEARLNTVEANIRPEAEQALAKVKAWVTEGENKLKNLRDKGEASLAEAKTFFESTWTEFEAEVAKWVEIANSQQATFEAQAKAQKDSWQGMVDKFAKQAAEAQKTGMASAEAEMERLKAEAKQAEAQLEALKSASETSWGIMSKGLEKSRTSFEKAAHKAWAEFNKNMKG